MASVRRGLVLRQRGVQRVCSARGVGLVRFSLLGCPYQQGPCAPRRPPCCRGSAVPVIPGPAPWPRGPGTLVLWLPSEGPDRRPGLNLCVQLSGNPELVTRLEPSRTPGGSSLTRTLHERFDVLRPACLSGQ